MTLLVVNQDFETDVAPFTLTDTMSRSATNKINGSWSLRGGDGTAKDGKAVWSIAAADRPKAGNTKGLLVQAHFLLKRVTMISGTPLIVLSLNDFTAGSGTRGAIVINASSDKLHLGLGSATEGPTALGVGARTIDYDYRDEGANGCWARIWLDGTLECEERGGNTNTYQVGEVVALSCGVSASGKGVWEYIWDDMKVWFSYTAMQ